MAKLYPVQTNFTAGEFSPRLLGRVDIAKYNNALKTMTNATSLPHGGATRRMGSNYIAGVKTDANKVRLIPFSFSITQNYILEFGNTYFRVYKDNGQVLDSGSAVEVATPYLTAELFDLKFCQSADTLYVAHINHAPRKITRSSHTSWSVTTISFTSAPSNFAGSAGEYPGAVSFFEERLWWGGSTDNPQTVWASKSGDFENMTQGSDADHSLEYTLAASQVNVIKWLAASPNGLIIGTVGGEFVATGGGDPITPTSIQINIATRYGSNNVTPIEAGRALLFIQRAGTKLRELAFNLDVDGLVAPDLTILSEHITSGNAGYTITDMAYQHEPDTVIWLTRSDGRLLSVTYERDQNVISWASHIIGGHYTDATVTVTDYANIAVGTTITVTKSDGTTVVFTSEAISGSAPSETNGWRPNESNDTTADNIYTAINAHADFTVANPSANVVTIKETSPSSYGLLSVTSSDSTRLACVSQGIAQVESVATIPSVDGTRDDVWVSVLRTINGSTKRFVEWLNKDVFCDSALEYSGSSTTSFSGLGHLEGETVQIVGGDATDKAVYVEQKVSSGAVSISGSGVTHAYIGMGYKTTLETLSPEFELGPGNSVGLAKAWNRIIVRVYETLGMTINSEEVIFRVTSDDLGTPVSKFTGTKEIVSLGYSTDDLEILITQSQGLPMTVLNITGELVLHE
tara:strand:+ start:7842 stop:9905 length:2064 start_codon:yes stop_codon:yes gene_type:complete